MLFNKSGHHPPSTSPSTTATAMPPPPRISPGAARSNSNSSIASSIGSASSLNLNSTSGSVRKTPLATSSTNNVKEVMANFHNIEANNSKGSIVMPLVKSNYKQDVKLSYKNSYAENKAMLANKFRSAKQEMTPKKSVEQRSSLSEISETENVVPIPREVFAKPEAVAAKPEFFAKPEAISAKPEVVFAKPANVVACRQLDGYVGFANLPNQTYRKSVARGFDFTLMVVGESGLGKSTLINSMFLTDIYSNDYPGPSNRLKKTINVESTKVILKESSVQLRLTIVDTPGFGDAIDNSNCWNPVLKYVEDQYETFMDGETRVNRVPIPDNRVHACLYFIAPSGHGLKPLDVEFLRKLQDKVNIIPVIAKADTFNEEEIAYFKERINQQIAQANIRVYEPPEENFSIGEEGDKKDVQSLRDLVPFAVVGSNTIVEHPSSQGQEARRTRGRKYRWGVVDIENDDHCDFVPLRNMLIRHNLLDLIEVTNNVLYENFRCRKLAGAAGMTLEKIPNKNPLATLEEEKKEHQIKMLKMEKEMEEVFERKVTEKTSRLTASQTELETKLKEAQEKCEAQRMELEAKEKAFIEEKKAWELFHGVSLDELKQAAMDTLDVGGKKKTLANSISFRMGR